MDRSLARSITGHKKLKTKLCLIFHELASPTEKLTEHSCMVDTCVTQESDQRNHLQSRTP